MVYLISYDLHYNQESRKGNRVNPIHTCIGLISMVISLKLFFKTWYPVLPQIMLPQALRGCFCGGVVVFSKDENVGNAAWAVHVGRIFVT